ncbi:TPA: hypothetical protein NIH43_006307, partial [Pseudomonas aeruginosa]|nr:hypothetical protein [Pseudomonas aeruginosa]
FQSLDTSSLETGNAHVRQPRYQLPAYTLHLHRFSSLELADVKGQIVVQPSHFKETLTTDYAEQMIEANGHWLLANFPVH